MGWGLKRADAKRALLNTGDAERDVWMIDPKESKIRSTHSWLLIVARMVLSTRGQNGNISQTTC